MRIAFAALLFLGCGRIDFDLHEPTDEHSGTRLKRVLYNLGGSTFAADYFHDSLRDEDCLPLRLADGGYYCVPRGVPGPASYLDATCTMPAFDLSTMVCPLTAAYVIQHDFTGCSGVNRVWPIGSSVAATQLYQHDASGNCVLMAGVPTNVVSLGDEVAPGELVALESVVAPDPGRAQRYFLGAADGFNAQSTSSVYDTTLATECAPNGNVPGVAWAPVGLEQQPGSTYSDPACTMEKTADFFECHGLRFGGEYDTCSNLTVRSITETAADPFYFFDGQSCILGNATSNATYYDWGAAVTPMPLTQQIIPGTSRIGSVLVGAGSVTTAVIPYDGLLDATCDVRSDGTCRPVGLTMRQLFDDASCTTPHNLALEVTRTGCALSRPTPGYVQGPSSLCTFDAPVYVRGPVYTAPVFSFSGGSCMPYASAGYDMTFYEVGPQVTDFESATYVVER